MISDLEKSQFVISGENGLPESYPVPQMSPELLFYIQRNLNKNTVIYSANINQQGKLDDLNPIKVYWIKYTENGKVVNLNRIQQKAFGYESSKINAHTFEIKITSYDKVRLFLHQNQQGHCTITSKINGIDAQLSNIYVFADELGVFPQLKFIELYGYCIDNHLPIYQRITV